MCNSKKRDRSDRVYFTITSQGKQARGLITEDDHLNKSGNVQRTYNVTLRPVSVTIFGVEKQLLLHILSLRL